MTDGAIPPGGKLAGDPPWEPQQDGAWVCRRDRSIRLPYEQIIRRTDDGIPYLVPEIVLLFKAKRAGEPKNQAGFAATVPLPGAGAAAWLRWALRRVHPGHPWIHVLGQMAQGGSGA